jgi:hypothetical protein
MHLSVHPFNCKYELVQEFGLAGRLDERLNVTMTRIEEWICFAL